MGDNTSISDRGEAVKALADGPGDPEVVLLRITPAEGEIWDGPSSTIGRAVAFARTYASGAQEPPGDDIRLDFTG